MDGEILSGAKAHDIASEVSRLTGSPMREMRLTTRVYHDAGLSGSDYGDFLVWFSFKFNVNLAGVNVARLAPGEGNALGTFWPKQYVELTIKDFADLAAFPSWTESPLSSRKPKGIF